MHLLRLLSLFSRKLEVYKVGRGRAQTAPLIDGFCGDNDISNTLICYKAIGAHSNLRIVYVAALSHTANLIAFSMKYFSPLHSVYARSIVNDSTTQDQLSSDMYTHVHACSCMLPDPREIVKVRRGIAWLAVPQHTHACMFEEMCKQQYMP